VPQPAPRASVAGDAAAFNLAIIFILALLVTAFALPAYRDYTLREHSKLASIALDTMAKRYPSWQRQHPEQRPVSLEDLGFSANAIYVSSDGSTASSANINSVYRISMAAPDAPSEQSCGLAVDASQPGFVLYAEPVQTQRIDRQCERLCLSSSGLKAINGGNSIGSCWSSSR
jgi:Tfp pilus assembly protein PilE